MRHAIFIVLALFVGAIPISLVINSFDPHADASNVQAFVYIRVCGNGVVDFDELCDQGVAFNTGAYGTTTADRRCNADCNSWGPYCGDGTLQARFGEACDDGNADPTDLCSSTCQPLAAVPSIPQGNPPRGQIPENPTAPPGSISAEIPTKVVLRGKAYPNADVKVLLDGKDLGTTRADSNADFQYTTSAASAGTVSFGFLATDQNGINSLLSTFVFDVIQSAITTVNNIFIPPTIAVSDATVAAGKPVTLSGQSVPGAQIRTRIDTQPALDSNANSAGVWALQLDTGSLGEGSHAAKSLFQIDSTIKSGYGKSVNFTVGQGNVAETGSCDLNNDGKCNLIDFSIFLTFWGTSESRADFNHDGTVNLADFSIMLFNWTG